MIPIILRTEWGAQYGRGTADPGPEPRVVIHHSFRPALPASARITEEQLAIRSIERYHVESNGWNGVAYNFIVTQAGRIYEGRGWRFRGSHAGPVNGQSIGICLLIDGNRTEPSPAAMRAVRTLIRAGITLGEISRDYILSGHRDHMEGRTCPGERVYARLQELRHDAGPSAPERFEPEIVTPPTPHPAADDRPILERIEVPRAKHVEEILRVRRIPPEVAAAGLQAAEVLLRAVVKGQAEGRAGAVKVVADALSDWLKGRAA